MVVFMTSAHLVTALAAAAPNTLNTSDIDSVKSVAKTLAAGAMSYYPGTAEAFGNLPSPYYWWEAGALMGAMLDYSHYTNDTTYDAIVARGLLDNVGPDFNYMVPAQYGDEGNDDQAFWTFSVMAAAERNWLQPNASIPSWLTLGENVWNTMLPRWNTSVCGGGLAWQIFPWNVNGLSYRNSVANGGFFQLSARLARATNNQTYVDWAGKVWDWSTAIGIVDSEFNVYDGTDAGNNCSTINKLSFTYTAGIYGYGAAVLANHLNDSTWAGRAEGLFTAAKSSFFSPYSNSTSIMWERACEPAGTCDYDMRSFKGYLSRFFSDAAIMLPSLVPMAQELLTASAVAAGLACTGGDNGTTCGEKWYVGGYDNNPGLGQEMCALETVHGLLASQAPPPLKFGEIKDVRNTTDTPGPAPSASRRSDSSATGALGVNLGWTAAGVAAGLFAIGIM